MSKAREILHKHTRSDGCKAGLRINPFLEQAVLNAINEAINYTPCCTELRDEYLQPELDKYKNIKVE